MTAAAMKNQRTDFPEKNRYSPETAQWLLETFNGFEQGHLEPEWFRQLCYGALTALEEKGLPTPQLERWKYTNLPAALRRMDLAFGAAALAFGDGDFPVQKLSGVLAGGGADWLTALLGAQPAGQDVYHDMMLWDLSNIFLRDGLVVDIPAGRSVDKPVEIMVSGMEGKFCTPRIVIRLGAGADLTLIETQTGEGRYWNNQLTQIEIGANACLRHYRLQDHSAEAVYTQNTHVRAGRDARYEAFTLTLGGVLSRNQIHVALEGENAACSMDGVNLLRGGQQGDTTILAEHRAPRGQSNQFTRSVLGGQAQAVFQGKVHVHRAAQKTDGYQLSNALLLSGGAVMNTKPELEIYADDVKCSHGATTGQLDEAPLFYLRSRGLSEKEARYLLVRAFVGEAVDKIADKSFKSLIEQRAERWLQDVL